MYNCSHCNKESKTRMSIVQHELYCKSNPNRKIKKPSYGMLGKKGANQYSYGAEMSDETKKKLSILSQQIKWNDDQKAAHSARMKKVVEKNPESYTSSNRGRTKQIVYNGIKFQGSWELEFYKWCEKNSVECKRNEKGFPYEWNGKRTYYPDFYLSEHDAFVEVKGYKTDRDDAKWKQFPEKLLVVDKKDIDSIRKGCYNLNLLKQNASELRYK